MWNRRKMALSIRLFWLVLGSFSVGATSRKSGHHAEKSGGFWGKVTNYAMTILGGGVDSQPSYGQLFDYERKLKQQFKEMEELITTTTATDPTWHPIKFPEATAFSSTFIRDIGGLLEFWTDLVESKKVREGSRKISQHILWSRTVYAGSKGSISYFIYRPSFEAELDSSTILPHLMYHAEAQETFPAVREIIQQFPNDQIVFVGLQGAGAIAMLHSWMASSSVPILCKNLKEFKGELHQIKILLFDSDCVLSETYAPNFPIPAWDILRFYSGLKRDLKPDSCKFESMTPVGLAYPYVPNWLEFLSPSVDPALITRTQFVEYYVKNHKSLRAAIAAAAASDEEDVEAEPENVDEVFDESRSVVDSELSMSVDECGVHVINTPRSAPFRKQTSGQVQSIEAKIKPGIELLKNSVEMSQFFFKNLKKIYRSHQQFYLQRNVNGCAVAMERNLKSTLTGSEKDQPLVPRGIKDISCAVKHYDEKTKVALVVCNLVGNDSASSSILQFRTHVQNDMDTILHNRKIAIDDGDYEEVSLSAGDPSDDPAGDASYRSRARSNQSQKQDAHSFYNDDDDDGIFFDDRSQITGFQEKSEQWTSCLEELFKQVPYLNFINPLRKHHSSLKSVATTAGQAAPGSSVLSITLPFSSTLASCEYSFLTQPKNFYQLYSVSSSMFFSIFSDLVALQTMPPVCSRILEPPSIPHNKLGNAESLVKTLNGYFNSDGTAQIDFGNTIVNGLEIEGSTSNLPGNDPYAVFTTPVCNKIAECLAQNVGDKLYDCNSPLSLWAGRHHCPAVCLHRRGLHLCSRVIDCGEGIFLGFRGCKTLGSEKPIAEEFENYSLLNQLSSPAYYAAFHLKHVEGWSATLRRPFRFALFFSEPARKTYLPTSAAVSSAVSAAISSAASVSSASSVASTLRRKSSASQPQSQPQSQPHPQPQYQPQYQHQITMQNLAEFDQQLETTDDGEDDDFYKFTTEVGEGLDRKVQELSEEDDFAFISHAIADSNDQFEEEDAELVKEEVRLVEEGMRLAEEEELGLGEVVMGLGGEEQVAVGLGEEHVEQVEQVEQVAHQVANDLLDQTDAEVTSFVKQADEDSIEKGDVSVTSAPAGSVNSAVNNTGHGKNKKKKGRK